jgi:hypothetical protein
MATIGCTLRVTAARCADEVSGVAAERDDCWAKANNAEIACTPTSSSWLNRIDYAEPAVMPSVSAAAGCMAAGGDSSG